MPDKRQTSKQRRAARNRAYREAMIARRENAQAEREQARQARAARATATGSASGSGSAGRGGATATVAGPPAPGIAGVLYRRGPGPGDTAVLLALVLAVLAAGLSLYVALTSNSVPVDHAGDPIDSFPAVSREAYAIAHDTEPVTETISLVDAYGPVIPIFAVLPALVAAGAFVSHRRAPRSRPLTIGLVALALVSVFNLFAMYFLPALIALAVAGFQVRKTEMPARMAGGGAGRGPTRRQADDGDEVIDVDEVEPEDELDEDGELEDEELEDEDLEAAELEDEELDDEDLEDEEPDDADVRAGSEDEDAESDDVLAELEAELEDEPDDEAETPETGRRGRGRGAGGRSSRR